MSRTVVTRFDATTATCRVYTFKEGVLSALAHDLELAVERFHIEVAEGLALDARFAADSLRVRGAVIGRLEPISPSDCDKIERAIVEEVLDARRYPEIRYEGRGRAREDGGYDVDGELTLHGVRRPLAAQVRREGAHLVVEVTLHQPDFGIRPYRAMLGALRIRPNVRVRVETPPLP